MKKSAQPYNGKAINLDFLLDTSAKATGSNTEDSIVSISLDTIVEFRHQKRYYSDPNKLNDLKLSIERNGVSEPVLVRPHPDGSETYELIYGHRRVAASKLAGKEDIPARIKSLNDEEALTLHLDENLNRQDLNALEETEAILELLAHKLEMSVEETISLLRRMQNEARGKVTQNVLGSPQGLLINDFFNWYKGRISWESFVTSRLPLLNLPKEILEALRNGELEYTKAIAI
ncbi:MAG: ParB/RepB/Spo0J family partition protein [Cyanobacteria bacterium P01_E01_bin.6]